MTPILLQSNQRLSRKKTINSSMGEIKMKKVIFFTAALYFIAASFVNSQSFEAGILGGLNLANWDTKVENIERDVTSSTRFGAGVVIAYNITSNYAIQIEPMYVGKGSIIKEHDDSPEIEVETNYLEIPLLFKASYGETIRPFVLAGPSFGFFLSGTGSAEVSNLSIEMDLKPITKSTDISFTLGAGVNVPLWNGSFFFEGRYSFSLSNISQNGLIEWKHEGITVNTEQISGDENQFKNRGITLMMGYSIPIW